MSQNLERSVYVKVLVPRPARSPPSTPEWPTGACVLISRSFRRPVSPAG